MLRGSGECVRIDEQGQVRSGIQLDVTDLDAEKGTELRVSRDGNWAAVVEAYGPRGRMFDLQSGRSLWDLDRGNYHTNVSAFPVAFFENGGKTWLVHGTDWNRLDISDPATESRLSERVSPGRDSPDYLDYFHSRLVVSPDQKWVAEDGWIWHPVGETRIWSLEAWLSNPGESETGSTVRALGYRFYFWEGPLCWVDGRRIARWGLGDDDEEIAPGVQIFDVESGEEIGSFPGPDIGHLPNRLPGPNRRMGWMDCDEYLIAVSPEGGTGFWDIETGGLAHFEPSFFPQAYNRESGTFLSFGQEETLLSRWYRT